MKVFITKYVLTTGKIFQIDAQLMDSGMVKCNNPQRYSEYYYGEGNEWHRTPEAALVKAEEMRAKKLVALERSRKKIQNLSMHVVEAGKDF